MSPKISRRNLFRLRWNNPGKAAKAELNLERCLTSQGILCDTCALYCPPSVNAIRMVRRVPVLDVEACTGCGLCVEFCEAEPRAIRMK